IGFGKTAVSRQRPLPLLPTSCPPIASRSLLFTRQGASRYLRAERGTRFWILRLLVIRRHRLAALFPVLDDGFGLAGAVEHVELAADHRDDRVAAGPEVIAGIELRRLGGKD